MDDMLPGRGPGDRRLPPGGRRNDEAHPRWEAGSASRAATAGGPAPVEASSGDAARERRWRRRREGAVWSIGVGIAMLFLGGVSASLAMGGAVMVAGGGVGVAWSSLMLRRHRQDPWSDPEIDAWEREHFPPRPPAGGT